MQVLPHWLPCSPSLPSPSTVERWVLWKCFIVRIGLHFYPWLLKFRPFMSRGWQLVWWSMHDTVTDPCERCIWALYQVLSLPWCKFRAWIFCQRLFPSTFDWPETAFTLDVLDYYGIDAMECKTSAQCFFQKLRRVTNNTFPDNVPVCSSFSSNTKQLTNI